MTAKKKKFSEALKQAEDSVPNPDTEKVQQIQSAVDAVEKNLQEYKDTPPKVTNPIQDYVDGLLLAESDGEEAVRQYVVANAGRAAQLLKGMANWLEDIGRRESELYRAQQEFDASATTAGAAQALAAAISAPAPAETQVTQKATKIMDQLQYIQGQLNDFQAILAAGVSAFMASFKEGDQS